MPKILIIDDEEQICKFLTTCFNKIGCETVSMFRLKTGLQYIFSHDVDVVFLDVNLPDGNGLEAIEIIRQHPLSPEIIIITGDENADGAELAMRSKAWDYIPKKGSYKNFVFALERALEYRKQKKALAKTVTLHRNGIIGDSPTIKKCLEKVIQAAGSDIPVLISGETGTGKELFSKAIHQNSSRSKAEFVVVDCASLPEHLVETTLFGHQKGAFTGAESDKTGLMKMASKGTLFLDEIGELPLTIQKKFLRVLQEKRFRPVGGKKEEKSDFRLICATHRDLEQMVREKKFREDLYFRIFSMNIHLPPLKDREGDIQALAFHHLKNRARPFNKSPFTMSPEFLEELALYQWPGNVRELMNTLDLVCNEAGPGSTLYPHHLPGHIRAFNIRHKFETDSQDLKPESSYALPVLEPTPKTGIQPFKAHIDQAKFEYMRTLISATNGNVKESCQLSGLSRGHLYRLMQQFNLKP